MIEDPWRVTYDYNCIKRHQFILPNRHIEGLNTIYNRTPPPNAYILGSSVSQAFLTTDWAHYLPSDAQPVHFDGLGESLRTVRNKVAFISGLHPPKHILVILDADILFQTQSPLGPVKMEPPEISTNSEWHFWRKMIAYALDYKFFGAYIDHSLTGRFRPYMNSRLMDWGNDPHQTNCHSNDEWSSEKGIQADSAGFFGHRISRGTIPRKISLEERSNLWNGTKQILFEIDSLLPQNCSVDIIIPPRLSGAALTNQSVLEIQTCIPRAKISLAKRESAIQGYFYDAVHIRPILARYLLREHYLKP